MLIEVQEHRVSFKLQHINKLIRSIQIVRYFDTDKQTIKKYANNMKDVDLEFIACDSAKEACEGAGNYRCMHCM